MGRRPDLNQCATYFSAHSVEILQMVETAQDWQVKYEVVLLSHLICCFLLRRLWTRSTSSTSVLQECRFISGWGRVGRWVGGRGWVGEGGSVGGEGVGGRWGRVGRGWVV